MNAHVRILMENSENLSGRESYDCEIYALNRSAIIVLTLLFLQAPFSEGNRFFTDE
jgi:hypothetical protein